MEKAVERLEEVKAENPDLLETKEDSVINFWREQYLNEINQGK